MLEAAVIANRAAVYLQTITMKGNILHLQKAVILQELHSICKLYHEHHVLTTGSIALSMAANEAGESQ